MVVHLPLINVTFPSNANLYYTELIPICTYDIIEMNTITDLLEIDVNTTNNENVNPILERMIAYGYYDDENAFNNIATLMLFTFVYYLRVIIMLLVWLPVNKYLKIKRSLNYINKGVVAKPTCVENIYESEK